MGYPYIIKNRSTARGAKAWVLCSGFPNFLPKIDHGRGGAYGSGNYHTWLGFVCIAQKFRAGNTVFVMVFQKM